MKYALGNMLNGAGGLNADQLALDLQFAADKTLTARKGPTPVFTRASSGTFVGSNGLIQSAGNNVARFDHDPANPSVCRGLLIEESRTNLILQSEDINSATWSKVNGTTSNNFGTSPDGTTNADKFVEDAIVSGKYFRQANLITIANGTAYAFSVYAKADGRNFCTVGGDLSNGFLGSASFDLLNGTVGAVSAGTTATIQSAGSGWYRLVVVSTSIGTSIRPGFLLRTNSTSVLTQNYQGDGVSGVLFWGAQLEAGSFASSYIPTTTVSVVRSADVCSISGAAFSGFYNQPEGTLFADVTPQAVDQLSFAFGVNTTTFNASHGIYKSNATVSAAGRRWVGTTIDSSVQAEITTSTDVAVSRSRLAYAYKINNYAFAYNGSIIGTDTSATVPSPTAMRIGSRDDGRSVNGHLATIRYYRKRLSNSKLASLTI